MQLTTKSLTIKNKSRYCFQWGGVEKFTPILFNFDYMNSCFSDLIGVRGMCEDINPILYLDDIGVGLELASKLADSKFKGTGRELVDRKIQQAWREAFKDLSIDGFQFKKIACEKTFEGNGHSTVVLDGSGKITISKYQKLLTSIQFKSVHFSGIGEYSLTISDGDDTFTYVGSAKNISIPNKFFGQKISIEIMFENANVSPLTGNCCEPCSGSGCNFSISASKDFGLSFVIQEICDYESYLCRYAEMIAEAVVYKAGALILTEAINTQRINDSSIVNEKDLWTRIAYLDSSLNLFQFENQVIQSSTSTIEVKPGRYQFEIERISKQIPKPKDPYCISCDAGFYAISLP